MLKMRYKGFTWPNNPKTYTISCERQTAVHKIPMGGFVVQDLGQTSTVLRGEGEFMARERMRRTGRCWRRFPPAARACWCIRCGSAAPHGLRACI